MNFALKLKTAPAAKAFDVATLKTQNDVSRTDQDTLIEFYGDAAVEKIENFLWRKMITQTWELHLEDFPCLGPSKLGAWQQGAIRVPFPPLQSVESIVYVDQQGDTRTFDPSNYIVDSATEPARIVPGYQKIWPVVRRQPGAVIVTFTCGYGDDSTKIPSSFRLAIQYLYAHLYMNREPIDVARGVIGLEIPFTLIDFLSPYRVEGV